jgi:surface antigen
MREGDRRRAEDQEWELRQIEVEQQQRNLLIRNTDQRLLPLSPDGGISPQTHSAIMSAVFAALDMNAPGTSRDWRNAQTGSHGSVSPQHIVQNIFGEPCREFSISLTDNRGQTRTTAGTACRKNGQWVWPNG